ncbi:MAG: hypothetical protein GX244_09730 [Firmicutes bacterium]|jgi:hypothetical protein|nr:hypothetical protein [Bacillota bacterium]
MTVKKKKPYLTPSLPRKITRYRYIDESSSYLPHVFNQSAPSENGQNMVILDERGDNSSGK